MNKPILVVMAAGMGSRYGGLKQIDPVGPNGEIIIDYSLFDAKKAGFENVIKVKDMEEAVAVCKRDAQSGDCVLLSPACASWGMFDNYEQRGRIFKELVRKL